MNDIIRKMNVQTNIMKSTTFFRYYLQEQNMEKAMIHFRELCELLSQYINHYNLVLANDLERLCTTLGSILAAQEKGNWRQVEFLVQSEIVPVVQKYIQMDQNDPDFMSWLSRHKNNNMQYLAKRNDAIHQKLSDILMNDDNDKYSFMISQMGWPVLCNANGYIIESMIDPYSEAIHTIKASVKENTTKALVCGCGMGYIPIILWNFYPDIEIEVYINKPEDVFYYLHFFELEYAELHNVKIIYDENYGAFIRALSEREDTTALIYTGMMLETDIEDKATRILKRQYIRDISYQNQEWKLNFSFIKNTKMIPNTDRDLEKKFEGKDVYIVAAGPSLDKNIDCLKKVNRENTVILCTGTAYKRLMRDGIRPDYVIVLDSKDSIWNQFTTLENEDIPVIMASTACTLVTEKYRGEKYIIFQQGFQPAENYALKNGLDIYPTGGSVSTIAMSLAIQLKAEKIIFTGLDLAYTNNMAHAEGTSNQIATSIEHLHEVDNFNKNGIVYSDDKFDLYRKWFTREIKKLREQGCEIRIINATGDGSYIEGMEHLQMEEVAG